MGAKWVEVPRYTGIHSTNDTAGGGDHGGRSEDGSL